MFRTTLTLACVLVIGVLALPAAAKDCTGCKTIADKGEGFCLECGKGEIFGVKLDLKKLYDALAGQAIEKDKIKCPGCKVAAKTDGSCSHCRIGMAHGKAYHSPVAHKLAKGKPYTEKKAEHCPDCKDAFAKNGFCTACNAGFVAHRQFKDKDNYDAAMKAHKTLVKATEIGKKCETCAVSASRMAERSSSKDDLRP
ncbi:MAG: hypothetical protein ACYSVY_26010 [Planctomycetota bacterium]|jgi:hypothetical protein